MRATSGNFLTDQVLAAADSAQTRPAITLVPSDLANEPKYWKPGFAGFAALASGILPTTVGVLDFILVILAAMAALAAYSDMVQHSVGEMERYLVPSLFAATLFVGGFERLGGYRLKRLSKLHWQLTRTLITWGVIISTLLLLAFLGKLSENYSRGWTLTWALGTPALLVTGRALLHLALAGWAREGLLARNIVIVGAGVEGQRLLTKLRASQDKTIAICGVFDDRKSRLAASPPGFKVIGTTDDLLRLARRGRIDEVIIALPLDAEYRIKALFDKLKTIAVDLRLSVEPVAEKFRIRGVSYIGEVPVLEIADRPLKHWRAAVKWIEDMVLGTLLLTFVGPLMLIIAFVIKMDSPGPIFFVQKRFGFNNNIIRVLKFRTMYIDRGDKSGAQRTVLNDPRVTRVGRILRSLSLDELPQLINVLRGDMSLVGPRPHPIAMKAGDRLYYEAIDQYFHRHRVKPGITGWAQVYGLRGEVDTLEKGRARVAHDLYYIDNWSLWLDMKTLLKTGLALLHSENVY
jgi:Undecaprenyl-phosphate glucose phosphotransferase